MIAEIRELKRGDDRANFDCGDEVLNIFFRTYAGQNQFRHHIGVTYVALTDDKIVGYATVSPASMDADALPSGKKLPFFPVPVLRIARLAVEKKDQGKGIGKLLLQELIGLCTTAGYRQMIAVIGNSANTGSIALHKACGFSHSGTLKDIGRKHGQWLDVVLMQRALGEGGGTAPQEPSATPEKIFR